MSERKVLKRLLTLVHEEIIFLDRGYENYKPEAIQKEYDELQVSLRWLEEQVNRLNNKDYPNE